MTEALLTRTEHSRSLADAEKYRALQTLQELGLLTPLAEMDLYHGRAAEATEVVPWSVDPTYANGSNDSGNNNINIRPSLYTTDEDTAKAFASERRDEAARKAYGSVFVDKVHAYTPDERQAWLDRKNKQTQERWDRQPDEIREAQKRYWNHGPKVYTMDDLDGKVHIELEARLLRDATSEEEKRAIWERTAGQYKPEVRKIVSPATDASVIDLHFNPDELSDDDQARYHEALRALIVPLTEGSPVDFINQDAAKAFTSAIPMLDEIIISQDTVKTLAEQTGYSEDVMQQMAGSYNALCFTQNNPSRLVSMLFRSQDGITLEQVAVKDQIKIAPFNMEYIERYLQAAHIIGAKTTVLSATIGREAEIVSFFNRHSVNTRTALENQRQSMQRKLGAIATVLGDPEKMFTGEHELVRLLADAHAKPKDLVAAAQEVSGYKSVFMADAGNWEGYTLGEHTETVLHNFDENYADTVPVQVLAPMRLALLLHDLGKPAAVAQGEKRNQKNYTARSADDFMTKLGAGDDTKRLVQAVIGDGAELAYHINVLGDRDESAAAAMQKLARRALGLSGLAGVRAERQIQGFVDMCTMLQICDGGAYTSMAVTRSADGKGRYRNAPSFNASFAAPTDPGKRQLRLRKGAIGPAARDLTPKLDHQQ